MGNYSFSSIHTATDFQCCLHLPFPCDLGKMFVQLEGTSQDPEFCRWTPSAQTVKENKAKNNV